MTNAPGASDAVVSVGRAFGIGVCSECHGREFVALGNAVLPCACRPFAPVSEAVDRSVRS